VVAGVSPQANTQPEGLKSEEFALYLLAEDDAVRIADFIWLEEIVEKLEVKHGVIPEEVEEIFANRPRITRMERGRFQGEDVYRALGQTNAGRYLAAFFIHKRTDDALILSARDMDRKERKAYAR